MAGHRLVANTGTEADAQLGAYLADLARRLRGPHRRRAAIVAELRDGLHHASEDHIAAGLAPTQAAAAAIKQFGDPKAVADAFAGELATGYARRTIAWYIATGPLVGIWWLLLLQPHPWRTGLVALVAAIPVLPVVVDQMRHHIADLPVGQALGWRQASGNRVARYSASHSASACMSATRAARASIDSSSLGRDTGSHATMQRHDHSAGRAYCEILGSGPIHAIAAAPSRSPML